MLDETVNAVSGEVVNTEVEETTELKAEVSGSVNSEVATEPEQPKLEDTKDEKPKQSAEENARFAEVRRKTEQESRDKTVREMAKQFGWDPSINSWESYQKAIQAEAVKKEAEEKGVEPEFLSKVKDTEKKLAEYEKKEERNKMYIDFREKFPNIDYKDVPSDIWKSVEEGGNLTTLYREYAYDKLVAELEAQKKVAETNKSNAEATTGSVKGKSDTDDRYFTQDEFDKHRGDKGWITQNYKKVMASFKAKQIQH